MSDNFSNQGSSSPGTRVVFFAILVLSGCSTWQATPIKNAPESFHPVLQELRDSDFNVRMRAAQKLGEMGAAAEPAVPYLIEALNDKAVKVRIWVALALGEIGPTAKSAIPELRKATTREYNEWGQARQAAQAALDLIE